MRSVAVLGLSSLLLGCVLPVPVSVPESEQPEPYLTDALYDSLVVGSTTFVAAETRLSQELRSRPWLRDILPEESQSRILIYRYSEKDRLLLLPTLEKEDSEYLRWLALLFSAEGILTDKRRVLEGGRVYRKDLDKLVERWTDEIRRDNAGN